MTATNDEIMEAITELSNTAHGKLNILQDYVEDIHRLLKTSPPPPPPTNIHDPLFSSGKME